MHGELWEKEGQGSYKEGAASQKFVLVRGARVLATKEEAAS
jgi:hypothetical protein